MIFCRLLVGYFIHFSKRKLPIISYLVTRRCRWYGKGRTKPWLFPFTYQFTRKCIGSQVFFKNAQFSLSQWTQGLSAFRVIQSIEVIILTEVQFLISSARRVWAFLKTWFNSLWWYLCHIKLSHVHLIHFPTQTWNLKSPILLSPIYFHEKCIFRSQLGY